MGCDSSEILDVLAESFQGDPRNRVHVNLFFNDTNPGEGVVKTPRLGQNHPSDLALFFSFVDSCFLKRSVEFRGTRG
jgi:hypothetical protein